MKNNLRALRVAATWFAGLEFIGLVLSLAAVAIVQAMTPTNAPVGLVEKAPLIIFGVWTFLASVVAFCQFRAASKSLNASPRERLEYDQNIELQKAKALNLYRNVRIVRLVIFVVVSVGIGVVGAIKGSSLMQSKPANIKETIARAEEEHDPNQQYAITGKVSALLESPYELFEPGRPKTAQGLMVVRDGSDVLSIHYDLADAPKKLAVGDTVSVLIVREIVKIGQGANADSSVYHAVKIEAVK